MTSPIKPDRQFSLGAYFMQSASMNLQQTTSIILGLLDQALMRGGTADSAVKHNTEIHLCHPDGSVAFKLPIRITIHKCTLASEILDAAFDNALDIQCFHVVSGRLTQARLVLLIESRVVAQLFCFRQSLRLQIKERPEARVMAHGVLALGRLEVGVQTPLGSVPADSLH
jgi:hypothetical protein